MDDQMEPTGEQIVVNIDAADAGGTVGMGAAIVGWLEAEG